MSIELFPQIFLPMQFVISRTNGVLIFSSFYFLKNKSKKQNPSGEKTQNGEAVKWL